MYIFKCCGNLCCLSCCSVKSKQQHRVVSSQVAADKILSEETESSIQNEIDQSIRARFAKILSDDERRQLISDWQVQFKNENFVRNVCASCSKWEHSFENKYCWVNYDDVSLNLLCNSQIPTIYC
jgi:hypothetical protein